MLRHAVARSTTSLTSHLPIAGPSRLPFLLPCTCGIDRQQPSRRRQLHRSFATASHSLQSDTSLSSSASSVESLESATPAILHHLNPAKPPPAAIVEATHSAPVSAQGTSAQNVAHAQKASPSEAAAKPARRSFKAAKAAITLVRPGLAHQRPF